MSEPFVETRGRGGAPQPTLPELVGALGTCRPASIVRCLCPDHEIAVVCGECLRQNVPAHAYPAAAVPRQHVAGCNGLLGQPWPPARYPCRAIVF